MWRAGTRLKKRLETASLAEVYFINTPYIVVHIIMLGLATYGLREAFLAF